MKKKAEKILKLLEDLEFELNKGGDNQGLDMVVNLYDDWGKMVFGEDFGKQGIFEKGDI